MTYRAAIGAYVSARLSHTPGVMKLPAKGLDIFLAREFMTPPECAEMIRHIDSGLRPSELLADVGDPEFRTSSSCDVDHKIPFIARINERISGLLGIQPEHGEAMQGQRYDVGQQFKPHHDYFYYGEPYWEAMDRVGGQRTWTAMIFLNQPAAGGQTFFEHAGVRVTPRTGNLLTWNNMNSEGEPNTFSLHQGTPVIEGLKYVITKWYRERPWGLLAADVAADGAAQT
jgi:prolyl 4-hydroxylase